MSIEPCPNDKPCFDVAVVGLAPQHLRLIEVVFRHIRYNRFVFRLAAAAPKAPVHILIAGIDDPQGLQALARARSMRPALPAIAVADQVRADPARPAIEIGQLVRQLLPILNRVVEIEGLASGGRPVVAPKRAPAPSVLVVEDSELVRVQLTDAFARMGLAVETASTAGEALRRLDDRRVDLAMLDVVLPDLDGLQLARRIRREPRWSALPIVALSSRTSALDIVRGAAAGCDAYLGKPVHYADLRRTVAGQLGRVLAPEALPEQLMAA